jgi:acyl dehydratase
MGKKQLYYEDVEVGGEVTPLAKVATSQMLVKWAGASGDFNPLHYSVPGWDI